MDDLIGKSLGRYHILEQLGKGGMATVYKAYDTNLEREVAVKVIRREAFPPEQTDQLLKRFEREAKALAKLAHPNIVAVIDYGSQDDNPYLVMVYMPGGTLKQKLGEPMPWPEAVRLLLPIARALQFAHSQGIIHRDVKPSNILLTESGDPMLTDFGIAKILESGLVTQLTATGVGVGTPDYMAPEQWSGAVGPQTDIYSLGVVLYQMVTGRLPFIADTPAAVLIKHARDPLPRPKSFVPDLPDAVEQLLIKALAKEPENRFRDMGAFADALNQLTKAEPTVQASVPEQAEPLQHTFVSPPVPARPGKVPVAIPPPPATRKRSLLAGLAAGVGVLVLAGAAIVLFSIFRHPGIQIQKPHPSQIPAVVVTPLRGVSIELGATNVSNGLTQVGDQLGDGRTSPASIGGKEARVTVTNGSPSRHVYFFVDPAFHVAKSDFVIISIEYFDQGVGSIYWFTLDYDAIGLANQYKSTPWIWLANSGLWKTAYIDLPDAFFGGRENYGADFRISTPDNDLYFSTVTVTKQ